MPYLGNSPDNQTFLSGTDYFSGNGSTVLFTLSRQVTSINDILVVVENVVQYPGDAYSVIGNQLTFTGTPPSGTNNIYVRYMSVNTRSIGVSDGAITTPKIQDVSVTSSKLADSAIITSKIADGAITSSKIADGAITSTDLNATLDLSSKTITLSVSTLGIPGTQTNPFKSIAQAQFFGVQRGLYYFTNGTLTQQLYYDHADGGWILISSSNSSDSTFPGGTSRNSTTYYVNRNGTAGSTGTISPNNDYLIGSWLDAYKFTRVRGIGFGRGSTNGTYTWPTNPGVTVECQWACESYTQIVNKSAVPVQITSDGSGVPSGATYFIMDAVRMDFTANGTFDANSNQSTIGWAAVTNSNGDPVGGTYLGHGSAEGSFEGWYNAANSASDCQGWTTWVR